MASSATPVSVPEDPSTSGLRSTRRAGWTSAAWWAPRRRRPLPALAAGRGRGHICCPSRGSLGGGGGSKLSKAFPMQGLVSVAAFLLRLRLRSAGCTAPPLSLVLVDHLHALQASPLSPPFRSRSSAFRPFFFFFECEIARRGLVVSFVRPVHSECDGVCACGVEWSADRDEC